jgi:hypothetical protein
MATTNSRLANGPCIACFKATDTALGTEGEAEWHTAFLTLLGLEMQEAEDMVSVGTGNPLGKFPNGRFEVIHRVCADCAAKTKLNFPKPTLSVPGMEIPCARQPD